MGECPLVEFEVGEGGGARSWRVSFPAMGTRVDLIGAGGDLPRITRGVCRLVAELEALWSVFRPDSDVSRINSSEGWCEVDPRTDSLLLDSLALSEATGGAFTPLAGALARLWDVKGARRSFLASGRVPEAPSQEEIDGALRSCDPALLERDEAARWRLARAVNGGAAPSRGPALDLGAIAKGATADAVRDAVVAAGAEGVLVSLGTSSIASFGRRWDGRPWTVGLREPGAAENEWTGSVELSSSSALSTSGDYAPASFDAGRPFPEALAHETFDPRTGRPSESGVLQASVICASGVMAEALSTALLVAGEGYVDGARLDVWGRARGLSTRWESVVARRDGIAFSEGAGWVPKGARGTGGSAP